MAVASALAMFNWGPKVGLHPVQIDSFLRYDDNGQITQWDGIIRRFAWTLNELEPQIAAAAAEELGITGAAAADHKKVLQTRAAVDICKAHTEYCTDENAQYTSETECMDVMMNQVRFGHIGACYTASLANFLLQKPFGEWYQIGLDSGALS